MKKAICLAVFLAFLMGCSDASAQTGDNKRFVGSWNLLRGQTLTFKSNGTYEVDGDSYRYFTSGSKLIFERGKLCREDPCIYNYYLSSDGKILVLERIDGQAYWLTKK